MLELDKNIEDLKIDLFSGNTDLIVETIHSIKLSPHYELIDSLFDLYLTTQKQEIKTELFALFIDIKDKRFVEKLVQSLQKPKFATISKDLISISWQTGLDFCNHLELFIHKMIEGDDEQSIECFSVIESSIDDVSLEMKRKLVELLKPRINDFTGIKKAMCDEVLYLLE
jgi:hypothetical protein